jgi:hypothetical protein
MDPCHATIGVARGEEPPGGVVAGSEELEFVSRVLDDRAFVLVVRHLRHIDVALSRDLGVGRGVEQ